MKHFSCAGMVSGQNRKRVKTKTVRALAICLAATVGLMAHSAVAEVRIRQDATHQTIGISGLTDREASCSIENVSGLIVRRTFGADAMTVDGFVIEGTDHIRRYVNVFVPVNLDRFTHNAVLTGLQRLTWKGRVVVGVVQACGSGPVLTLNGVQ